MAGFLMTKPSLMSLRMFCPAQVPQTLAQSLLTRCQAAKGWRAHTQVAA